MIENFSWFTVLTSSVIAVSPSDTKFLFMLTLSQYFVWILVIAIYNVTFHPLARFPGPKLYGAFRFPFLWRLALEDTANMHIELHKKYGSVVRLSPKDLSFNTSQALRGIYYTLQANFLLLI